MYELLLVVTGLLALAAVVLPMVLRDRLVSYPVVLVLIGALLGVLAPSDIFDPIANGLVFERLTELALIVALCGLGLSIDRRITLRGWATTWRLLGITMPLTIVAAALLGWWVLGLVPAAALLFGAALAPTDPVLALDVQTGPPTTGDPDTDEVDEVRFGLSSESSLNDGLAFPFTNLAILLGIHGSVSSGWVLDWLLVDVAYRVVAAVGVGWLLGKALGWLTMLLVGGRGRIGMLVKGESVAPAIMALAITLVSYGVTELAHGYGFIAVFVTAYTIRNIERQNHVHDHLHSGAEQLELFAMGLVLVMVGAAFASSLWSELTWPIVVTAVVLVVVVRPVAGWVALLGDDGVNAPERAAIAVYGIRGLGAIYYLAYGLGQADFADATTLWTVTTFTVLVSLTLHGLTARPAMRQLERRGGAAVVGTGGGDRI